MEGIKFMGWIGALCDKWPMNWDNWDEWDDYLVKIVSLRMDE